MNLANFEKHFSKKILQRGKQYYRRGHVLEISQLDESTLSVDVEGSDTIYEVIVSLSLSNEVEETTCSCPFDYELYCKHQAAVLFAIREMEPKKKEAPIKHRSKKTLDQAMNDASKQQLMQFIKGIALEMPDVESRFIYQFEEDHLLKTSERLMKESMRGLIKRGLIESKNVYKIDRGLEQVSQKARMKLNDGHYQLSIELNQLIIANAIEIYKVANDSMGIIGNRISRSKDMIHEVAAQVSLVENKDAQLAIFNLIFDNSEAPYYTGEWEDTRNELMKAACYFAHLPEAYKKLENMIESLVNQADSFYERTQLLQLKLTLLKRTSTQGLIDSFLEENRDIPELRSQLIEAKREEGRFSEVIRLGIEGLASNQVNINVKTGWVKHLVAAYLQLEKWNEANELLETLLFQGDSSAYHQLKELYNEEEWAERRERIFDRFEEEGDDFNVYTKTLIQENLPERMLGFSEQSPSKILHFYPSLIEEYPDEVDQLFSRLIYVRAEKVHERTGYKEVCRLITQYRDICGNLRSVQMIEDLKVIHKKRPAFLDELGKIE